MEGAKITATRKFLERKSRPLLGGCLFTQSHSDHVIALARASKLVVLHERTKTLSRYNPKFLASYLRYIATIRSRGVR